MTDKIDNPESCPDNKCPFVLVSGPNRGKCCSKSAYPKHTFEGRKYCRAHCEKLGGVTDDQKKKDEVEINTKKKTSPIPIPIPPAIPSPKGRKKTIEDIKAMTAKKVKPEPAQAPHPQQPQQQQAPQEDESEEDTFESLESLSVESLEESVSLESTEEEDLPPIRQAVPATPTPTRGWLTTSKVQKTVAPVKSGGWLSSK